MNAAVRFIDGTKVTRKEIFLSFIFCRVDVGVVVVGGIKNRQSI